VEAAVPPNSREADELLLLALSRPKEALARARAVLAGRPDAYTASVARQAAGIVQREFGNSGAGLREMRSALRLARRTGSADREADVLATLGVGLVYAGRTRDGMAAFDQAVTLSAGVTAGRVLHRRGIVLWNIGRHAEALEDFRQAITVLRRAGDDVWTARALGARGNVYMTMGLTARADADFQAADRIFARTGQVLEAIYPLQNRAEAATVAGDLPAALAYLDEATARFRPLGVELLPDLWIDRCAVLLAAGLATEALAGGEEAIRDLEDAQARPAKRAELMLTVANCALAAGRPQVAMDRAQAAYRLFRSHQSTWWLAQCSLTLVRARYDAGLSSAQLLSGARRAVVRLEAAGSADAAQAHLLAGRIALDLGRRQDADHHFAAAALSRSRGPALARASGWLSEALRAEAAGDPRRLLAACRRGLAVLDEHRFTLGASELRAQATARGAELAQLAQRHAAQAGRPRLLLHWSDRWRATALAVPVVRPLADAELNSALAALREVSSRIDQARRQGSRSAAAQLEQAVLQRERKRLEGVVQASARRVRGSVDAAGVGVARVGVAGGGLAGGGLAGGGLAGGGLAGGGLDIAELLDRLGPAQLVDIVDVDGAISVLVCRAGRVRLFPGGRIGDAAQAAAFARFALRRLARSRPGDDLASASAILTAAGPRMQEALLGPAAGYLGDRPTVIVPPGKLHSLPWALLPALRDRVVSVAPSAASWLRAAATAPPSRHHVTLARGPGLSTEGAELPALARMYEDVTVLSGGNATADKVLHALDGAWLAHIAAHGTFRADSPLFSSLRMADGPLTVYDFEQLRTAPYRLVLSSCDSGAAAPAGADELLGLVSSLLPLGTAGVLASAVPLNDAAVASVMVDLHHHLRAGRSLAEAMYSVRNGPASEPIQHATAMSLVAMGAA
jgi:tetratricopeptide (TPR) repeat protein